MFNHKKYRPFTAVPKPNRRWPDNTITHAPIWCAVDLRDGNQALIEPMSVLQKQKLWALLVKMGFKQIEVGFPSASQADFDFVRWLIDEKQIPADVTVQVLVQARDVLIERTFASLQGIERAIVHVYNSVSPVQREKVFASDKAGIIELAIKGARKLQKEAQKYPDTAWTFEYSPESFSSTENDFSIAISNAVIDVWQPTPEHKAIFNLPATVECATPNAYADQIEFFCEQINRRDSIIVSVHTHNDRGCAVAAAEMAILAGADRVEGTLMGNGERTGNMDLITMAMNLYSQGIDPKLDISNADEITRIVSECTNISTHPRHPWVGELVYAAFSGSHQDAIKKCLSLQTDDASWDVAYLPINPRDVGRSYQSVIRVNSQSGKGGVAYLLEQHYGIALPRWLQIEMSAQVQALAEREQGEVDAKTIFEVFQRHCMQHDGIYSAQGYSLEKFSASGSGGTIAAEKMSIALCNGETIRTICGEGTGAVSAFCDAIQKGLGIDMQIQHYDQIALETGTNATAMVFVSVNIAQQNYVGAAQDSDIVTAGINALLVVLNRHQKGRANAA